MENRCGCWDCVAPSISQWDFLYVPYSRIHYHHTCSAVLYTGSCTVLHVLPVVWIEWISCGTRTRTHSYYGTGTVYSWVMISAYTVYVRTSTTRTGTSTSTVQLYQLYSLCVLLLYELGIRCGSMHSSDAILHSEAYYSSTELQYWPYIHLHTFRSETMSKCQKYWKIGHNAKSIAGIVSTAQATMGQEYRGELGARHARLFRKSGAFLSIIGHILRLFREHNRA